MGSQYQLPTVPLQRSVVQPQCITVDPGGKSSHLSGPELLPSAVFIPNLLPQNRITLVPLSHRIQEPTMVSASTVTTNLPPTGMNGQLFSQSGSLAHDEAVTSARSETPVRKYRKYTKY